MRRPARCDARGPSAMWDLIAFAGAFIAIEGALYAAAPGFARRMAARAAVTPDAQLRLAGLVALLLGVGTVWLVRG